MVQTWTAEQHSTVPPNGRAKVVRLLLDDLRGRQIQSVRIVPRSRHAQLHNHLRRQLFTNARDCFSRVSGPAGDDDVTVQRLVLEHGAGIKTLGEDNKTALHEAANVGNLANVTLLLSWQGFKTSIQDKDQKNPLSTAPSTTSASARTPVVPNQTRERRLLLLDGRGVDIHARAGSALQEAIVRNRLAHVQKMLDRGASVQVQAAVRSGKRRDAGAPPRQPSER